jgi:hypothetical protein
MMPPQSNWPHMWTPSWRHTPLASVSSSPVAMFRRPPTWLQQMPTSTREQSTAALPSSTSNSCSAPHRVWAAQKTPIERLYLGSASAHPGGGVHGPCVRNAARAALASDGMSGAPRRFLTRMALDVLTS